MRKVENVTGVRGRKLEKDRHSISYELMTKPAVFFFRNKKLRNFSYPDGFYTLL